MISSSIPDCGLPLAPYPVMSDMTSAGSEERKTRLETLDADVEPAVPPPLIGIDDETFLVVERVASGTARVRVTPFSAARPAPHGHRGAEPCVPRRGGAFGHACGHN